MSSDIVPTERVAIEVEEMNQWLDSGITDAERIVEVLRELRANTHVFMERDLDEDELPEVEDTSNRIREACGQVSDARDEVDRLND